MVTHLPPRAPTHAPTHASTHASTQLPRQAQWMIFLLFVLASILFALPAHASLQAQVDRNPVELGQSFTLSVQSSEDGEPDLSPLQRDFNIVAQSKSSNFQFNNGSASRSIVWQITLIAKREGQLVVPPLRVNGKATQPITLEVADAGQAAGSTAGQGQNAEILLEAGLTPQSAYVQQRVILTVRLYRAVNLGNGSSLSEPKFPDMDAVVERIGKDRTFNENRNGVEYAVIERRYAIYPQKSGQFVSEPIQFDGEVVGQGGFFQFDPFNQRSRHVRLNAKALQLTVKPIPGSFKSDPWLPAKSLKLSEEWSQTPPVFTVGEPITRTLTLTADGVNAAQLPSLGTVAPDSIKLYPDQPLLKNPDDVSVDAKTIREQKIAMIPTRAGPLELPAIELRWWNVQTNQEQVASLPARSVMVQAAAGASSGTGTSTGTDTATQAAPAPELVPPAEAKAEAAAPTAASGTNGAPGAPDGLGRFGNWWPWLSLCLGLGWMTTALMWRRSKRQPQQADAGGNAATMNERHQTRKQIESKLKQVCLANEAQEARTQLMLWGALRWPQHAPKSLTALARLVEPGLGEAVLALDRALYANTPTVWQGDVFWQVFRDHSGIKQQFDAAKALDDAVLAPLYRS